MYLDYVLLSIGGLFLLAALLLTAFLMRSREKSLNYRRLLSEETERLDVITTLRQSQTTRSSADPDKKPMKTVLLAADEAKPLPKTELISRSGTSLGPQIGADLDLSPLNGKYELLREIHGGGMSRIFLARNMKLGSDWIVKFVEQMELAEEAEVLKKLNHISLPPIVDIFQTLQGTFLVERYIEGYSLSEVLALGQEIRESQICDWGLQLAQVLHYLHTLPTPIIHCDLKPSNIMVTHDNRLVLIDFGISKRQGIDGGASGITYHYAAPEQFRGQANRPELLQKYFESLLPGHECWPIDARTDIYSVGVILRELAGGEQVSSGLSKIIGKCLEVQPEKRFQSARELAETLETMKGRPAMMARSLLMRRVAAVCCGLCAAGSLITTASGAYVNRMENLSAVSMNPGKAVVTEQQSVQLLIQKTAPGGKETLLDPGKISWSYSQDNIARLDGDRLVGLNVGETVLYGKYRNKIITLEIAVTEPPAETTAVALRYAEGPEVSPYAGNGKRDHVDGGLSGASFVSPESMSWENGRLYLSDSGIIRVLEDGKAGTLLLDPDYLTADIVRSRGENLYVLTGPWEAENGSWYGFLRIGEGGAEVLYYTEAAYSMITDFAFSSDGTLWFIQQNMLLDSTSLNRLDPETGEPAWVMDLPESARCAVFDMADNLYISVPEQGVILRVGAGEKTWTYFAGVDGQRNFIDGAIPNFYRPTSMAMEGDALYVLDFDAVRKITVEGAGALFTETLAGVPTADTNPKTVLGPGGEAVLPASERAALTLMDGRLLLSDPKNSVVYQIASAY